MLRQAQMILLRRRQRWDFEPVQGKLAGTRQASVLHALLLQGRGVLWLLSFASALYDLLL
jgi:hypothetical protein